MVLERYRAAEIVDSRPRLIAKIIVIVYPLRNPAHNLHFLYLALSKFVSGQLDRKIVVILFEADRIPALIEDLHRPS